MLEKMHRHSLLEQKFTYFIVNIGSDWTSGLCFQVGGQEEYEIGEAIKDGRITKRVICWCIGTCAKMFNSDVSSHVCAICLAEGGLPFT